MNRPVASHNPPAQETFTLSTAEMKVTAAGLGLRMDGTYGLTQLLPQWDALAPVARLPSPAQRGRGVGGEGLHGDPNPYLPHTLARSVCP